MTSGYNRGVGSFFALRVAAAVGIAIALMSLVAMLWLSLDVLLLGFAGILIATMIRGLGDVLSRHSFFKGGWSVLAVIIVLVSLLAAAIWFTATPVVNQFDTLTKMLPQAADRLRQNLRSYDWGRWLVDQAYSIDWMSRRVNLLGKMTGALSTAFGAVVNLVVIAFLGLYLALQPHIYIDGFIRLFPVVRRHRISEVLSEITRVLRWWGTGIFCSMSVVGVISGVGLRLLGIPFPLALGLLAGVLSFVPYLGAIVSAIPAMAVALIQGPQYALYVAALYLGIHVVEGYLVTPMIQQYAVSLPPALLLFFQIMLGILVGGMGVVLAAPIAAVCLVVVKMLYVEDVLGDDGNATAKEGNPC